MATKKIRVVGSLTTMPNQYEKVVRTLESLHAQTYKLDAIYLSLPEVSRRLGTKYPPVPKEISDKCTIIKCTDMGPITKLYGGLLAEDHPDTFIISFDNDMVYPPTMVEKLVEKHLKYPNAAICSAGMLIGAGNCPFCAITPNENNYLYNIPKFYIPDEGRNVDCAYGYPGCGYVRKMFPKKHLLEKDFFNYALTNNDCLMNDDIVISGFLSLHNIERKIFPDFPNVDFVKQDGVRQRTEAEISIDMDKFFQRMNRAIDTCKQELGMYKQVEPVNTTETIFGISFLIILAIIVIIILCWLLFYYNFF